MADGMIFGAFVPQGWKLELAGIEGAEAQWEAAVGVARRAEALGYDSVWVYDHFHNVPRPSNETMFESWTVLAALSGLTRRVRLGHMVGCALYRNPALLAKMAATLDVVSGGRLEWGIGAGWYEGEFRAYGYDFPPAATRIGMLAETVEIVTALWREPETTYEGRWHTIRQAQCDPKPLQRPRPPVWIGGGGEQLTLRVVARFADRSNFGGKPHEWAHKAEVLQGHCKDVGRDYDEIVKTWTPEVFVRETEAELRADWKGATWGEPWESWVGGNLVGTPEQVAEKVERYAALGCGGIVPWCHDYPSTQTLELFGTKVLPELPRTAQP